MSTKLLDKLKEVQNKSAENESTLAISPEESQKACEEINQEMKECRRELFLKEFDSHRAAAEILLI